MCALEAKVKALAPVMINEVMRIVHLENIWYTAGILLPTPKEVNLCRVFEARGEDDYEQDDMALQAA